MVARLNQIIAIEKGTKSLNYSKIDTIHKEAQKPDLFTGHLRNYQPLDHDDPERLPQDRKHVQRKAKDMLAEVERLSTEMFDIAARKDWTNCVAKADVAIGDRVLIRNVPVTYLLFLEKQLTDLRTFIESMVVLDTGEQWHEDANDGLHKSRATHTHRTKKLQRPVVLYDATDKHPAQTQLITEDVTVGHWETVKHSGALPLTQKKEMSERITKLLQAVKQAREAANSVDEDRPPPVGSVIFDYVFRNP